MNSLDIGVEKEEIWTLSAQSLINLTYKIESETRRRLECETETYINSLQHKDYNSPIKVQCKKTVSDNNILAICSKNGVSLQDFQKKSCTSNKDNIFLMKISRNNSPKTDKYSSFHEPKPGNDNNNKKYEISTPYSKKNLNVYQSLSPSIVSNITVGNNAEFEIIESRDICYSDNISEKSMIGTNTTNYSSTVEHYETFVQAVFVSGLSSESNLEKIKGSEEFIAPCGHKECSFLPAFKPSILHSYLNKTAQSKPTISNLVSNMGFPLGIKPCYYCMIDKNKKMTNIPKPQQCFVNIMKNEKTDSFYISTMQYFIKMSIQDFESLYKINPLKEFANNYTNGNNPKISNSKEDKAQEVIQYLSALMINDNVLIPESISLVSKYPYFTSMETCLKTIISLQKEEINPLLSHIINEIPVPGRDKLVLFYVPRTSEAVKVYSPVMSNNESISLWNYKLLLDYFSIDNICLIFQLILLEQKILFVHNNYQELSKISFMFTNLIYPFSWINPYIPVLNLTTVQFLQSFIPFIMGCDEFMLKYADKNSFLTQGEVVIIQINKDTLSLNKNRKKITKKNLLRELGLTELPEKVMSFLVSELKVIKKITITNVSIINSKIKELFIKAMIMLIGDYKSFTFMVNDDMPLFNKEGFISNHQSRDMKAFLSELIVTQIFNQFLYNEKQLSNNQDNQNYNYENNNGSLTDNGAIHFFDTSYFMRMIPKYQSLINVQQVRKRSNSVSNRSDHSKGKDREKNKAIPNHINSSFHNTSIKEDNPVNTKLLSNNDKEDNDSEKFKIKTYLLMPYFISNFNICLNKQKIEDYIRALLKKKSANDINSVDHHCFIISNKKGYKFTNIRTIKRYYINTPSPSSQGIQKDLSRSSTSKFNVFSPNGKYDNEDIKKLLFPNDILTCDNTINLKKCGSFKNINNERVKIESINDQDILGECFKNICTAKKKLTSTHYEKINRILHSSAGRDYLTNLIFPDETIANEENHKQLTVSSYDDLVHIIKLCLKQTKNSEYHLGRMLTLACFSYYKIDKNNNLRYIYEDLINEAYPTNIWIQEEFWNNFCIEELQMTDQNDELDLEERILTVADIMMRLNLNKNFMKKIVINQNASKIFQKEVVNLIENKLFN